nr:hypothetical protein [Tanacetum cinerariifolium]
MILGIQTTDPSPRPTFDFTAKLFSNMKLNWDGPHMLLLAPILVVHAGEDGADAAAAGAAAAHEVPPPPPPPPVTPPLDLPPTHTPSTATQDTPMREPTPSPVREPTTFWEPTPVPPRPPSPPPCTRSEEVGPTTSTAGNDSISIEDSLRPFKPWPTFQTTPSNTTTSTRPPSPTRQTSFLEDISEGGGGYVSSPKSNEAPPTIAAPTGGGAEDSVALTDLSLKLDRCINRVTALENELGVTKKVLGGAVMKLVSRVKRLEGILQQRKRRMVLSDFKGEEAATKEQEIDLDALHELASTSLGCDTTVEAAYTISKASHDAHASSDAGHDEAEVLDTTTMPFRHTISASVGIHADAQTIPADSIPIPTTGGVFVGSFMDPAGQATAAAAAPSSSAIPAADKGKAPMIDDSIPADLLTEQERLLGDDVTKDNMNERLGMLLIRKRRELAEQSQLLGDDVTKDNMNERLGMLLIRKRRELAEQSQVKPMNKTQQRDFVRDFMKNQSALVYNQGWTMKQVKALSIAQLKHEFEYIQRNLERSNLLNFKRSTFRPKPTLEAPTAKRARQRVPQVPATSSQVSASVPAAPSIAADVSVSAVFTTTVDPTLPTGSVAEVHANESRSDENQNTSEQVSAEHTSTNVVFTSGVSHATPTSSLDVADDALIKFDSASESDGGPSPYAPYVGWQVLPTPFGSIHAYYDIEEHAKHFTSLCELLHMVEKNDLRRLLGDVDKFYQRQEPETFGLILWGICVCCFSRLLMRMHMLSGVIRKAGVFAAGVYIIALMFIETTFERMLRHGLKVPKLLVGGDLTMAEQLVRFIKAALLNAQSAI